MLASWLSVVASAASCVDSARYVSMYLSAGDFAFPESADNFTPTRHVLDYRSIGGPGRETLAAIGARKLIQTFQDWAEACGELPGDKLRPTSVRLRPFKPKSCQSALGPISVQRSSFLSRQPEPGCEARPSRFHFHVNSKRYEHQGERCRLAVPFPV